VVDAVIHPKDTRARIAAALAALAGKQPEEGAWRKHSNIPL
jgi:acetyl-CoA carboxylase carboxyltransferase component